MSSVDDRRHEDLTLCDAVLRLGLVTAEQFDTWVRPGDMVHSLGA